MIMEEYEGLAEIYVCTNNEMDLSYRCVFGGPPLAFKAVTYAVTDQVVRVSQLA